jgi:hypothetical protein
MAVVTTKSTLISNRDATPKIFTDDLVSGGDLHESEGYVGAAVGDSVNSLYRFATVPSRARVTSMLLGLSGTLGAGVTFSLGVFWPDYVPFPIGPYGVQPVPGVGGTAINATLFASGQVMTAALQPPIDVINQAGNNSIPNQELSLWQAAGLTADPGLDLDIVGTVTGAAVGTAGYVQVKARYQD